MATKSLIPPLVVLSLGNPEPYEKTLHSAGHMALRSVVTYLRKQRHELKVGKEVSIFEARREGFVIKARAHSRRNVPERAQDLEVLLTDDSSAPWRNPNATPKLPTKALKNKGGKKKKSEISESTRRLLLAPYQPRFHYGKVTHAPPHNMSLTSRFCFHQSPSLMNVSGRFAHMLYTDAMLAFNRKFQSPALRHLVMPTPFVVVHDDLDLALGEIRLREFWSSARGHNGVKAVQAQMRRCTDMGTWYRLCVGIGRPNSRSPADVGEWVLRQVTTRESGVFEGIGSSVLSVLEQVEDHVRDRVRGLVPRSIFEEFEEQRQIEVTEKLAELEEEIIEKQGELDHLDDAKIRKANQTLSASPR